jgi:hypothetical protein
MDLVLQGQRFLKNEDVQMSLPSLARCFKNVLRLFHDDFLKYTQRYKRMIEICLSLNNKRLNFLVALNETIHICIKQLH